jgi:uncharacterized protein YbcC (UPF0753/DUF2309 family)
MIALENELVGLSDLVIGAADGAVRAIPPAWPLASSVAVNPYLGQICEPLWQAGARLGRVAGARVTMPRDWYQARISAGTISDDDLRDALASAPASMRPDGLSALKAAARSDRSGPAPIPTVAHLAAEASGIDWPGFIAERFGAWAASYFDEGQALWTAPRGKSAYAAWRAVATHDVTPEIVGLAGFALFVADLPDRATEALAKSAARLMLDPQAMETYFHQLLIGLGGWSQYARYKVWQAELGGASDDVCRELLAIRLVWEEALLGQYEKQTSSKWEDARAKHVRPVKASVDDIIDVILQEAWERSSQRALGEILAAASPSASAARPALQAAFCIDVRSERFRRALEAASPDIQTLGFAGFFGLTASHKPFASDVRELRLPVLLNPGLMTCSGEPKDAERDQSARIKARAKRAWGRFKLAAVSSFAFVEATGPLYVAKLLSDSLGLHGNSARKDPAPHFDPVFDVASRVKAAETVLRAMSLTAGFGRLVLLIGHGANVVNNPHASALHCGACGGYSGEVNARLLAALLNEREVREGLAGVGLPIPADTLFLGALHDTTTDRVTIYAKDHPSVMHKSDLDRAAKWLEAAGKATRSERALRLPRAGVSSRVASRSRNWAETRPEWALAECSAFIAAPRARTVGRNLDGRAFLHDYDWTSDAGFGTLELILTAPVVVASWISLQYYGSTVSPDIFGGGNKLLHNVVGGLGVVEGNGGLLRAGLPWQSVHDGERYVHEPLRLSVCVEAPREAMTSILERHGEVRFALDEAGRMAWRYAGDLEWVPVSRGSSDFNKAISTDWGDAEEERVLS